MTIAISANVGQQLQLPLQVLDGYGSRVDDGYAPPQVDFIQMPNGSLAGGYPSPMSKISTGLYTTSLVLPGTIGTYIVSVSWVSPINNHTQYEVFMVNAIKPFGTLSISPG